MSKFLNIYCSAFAVGTVLTFATLSPAQTSYTRQVQSSGTVNPQTPSPTAPGSSTVEIDTAFAGGETDLGSSDAKGVISINRPMKPGQPPVGIPIPPRPHRRSHFGVQQNFEGINFYEGRHADNGNQFSSEPPDQGLCVGNGYVVESTNSALNIYDQEGTSLLPAPLSLNQFYGYPSAYNRANGQYGKALTDPTCVFDQLSQRFYHLVLTFDRVGTTYATAGTSHLDLAVSQTANPLGDWKIYSIATQDDGTQGTPNHHCYLGRCFGDYPHIGVDFHGIYITTNEFSLSYGAFRGAQIYALSKRALAQGDTSINVVQYDTGDRNVTHATYPGFTVWPATSIYPGEGQRINGGTEYLLSSLAVFQNNFSSQLQLWALTNTSALNYGGSPTLSSATIDVEAYGSPDHARQPGAGTNGVGQAPDGGNVDWPLGQCLNDPTCYAKLDLGVKPAGPANVIPFLSGNDNRMQQVTYAHGNLWASLGTALSTGDASSDGLAYFVLHPQVTGGKPAATVVQQGYVYDPGFDITYGTAAATEIGTGIISFTATGPSMYPSVGYVTLDAVNGAGPITLSAPGIGAQDGLTGYGAFNLSGFGGQTRWGDYGAAAVDGRSIWFAQEYIGQTCTLQEFQASPLFQCNGTRGLGNWGTRIAKFTP